MGDFLEKGRLRFDSLEDEMEVGELGNNLNLLILYCIILFSSCLIGFDWPSPAGFKLILCQSRLLS